MAMSETLPRFDGGHSVLLDRTIDNLLLRLRGLVLVAALLERRGASAQEIDAHNREAERVRQTLAGLIGGEASLSLADPLE
jgi:hypothetical protein